jgi:hypothetical protein
LQRPQEGSFLVDHGNVTYSTPNGFMPTVAGTYEWVATYSGDSNNNGVTSLFGSEPENAQQAAIISKRLFVGSTLADNPQLTGKPHHHVRRHHRGHARAPR